MSLTDERDSGHDLSWRAVSALESILIDEGLLDGMKCSVLGKTFDGRDLGPFGGGGEDKAGVHAPPIQMHGAGAALSEIAALLGARQLQVLAQEIEQGSARVDLRFIAFAIDA